MKQLGEMFPEHIKVKAWLKSRRSIIEIDRSFMVAVLLCRSYQRVGEKRYWSVLPTSAERQNMTLLCKVSANKDRISSYYLFSRLDIPGRGQSLYSRSGSFLRQGVRLQELSEFYAAVRKLHCGMGGTVNCPNSDLKQPI